MKRSHTVALVIVGAAAFAWLGQGGEQTEASAFPDQDACVAAARSGSLHVTEADCRIAFTEAQQTHLETAPRYESRALCEEEHGVGNCGDDPAAQQAPGGGFSFMPLFAGYMIGSMLANGRQGMASQPMVKTANGRFATPGGTGFASNTGTGKVSPQAFAKAPSTIGQPPMTKAQVAQRGGFGKSATGRAIGG